MASAVNLVPSASAGTLNPAGHRWQRLTYCTPALSAATGLTSPPGWILPLLRSVVPGAGETKCNTAITLLLAALSLVSLAGRPASRLSKQDLDDWEFLAHLGYDGGHRYYIARPMPTAEVPRWLQAWGTGGQSAARRGVAAAIAKAGRSGSYSAARRLVWLAPLARRIRNASTRDSVCLGAASLSPPLKAF